jgi:hypothetical protein
MRGISYARAVCPGCFTCSAAHITEIHKGLGVKDSFLKDSLQVRAQKGGIRPLLRMLAILISGL